ncbi:18137_t:CDS:2 [Funneliformis geosporum]|uniref:9052_t:CDS:1 n=1 Tax=Funneliformis geosporum TaxID=1117311 RepID=A0A9W4SKS9_9GLOM|nr:9052_t:CDS:2 [Funneliformis geosporum]CAI2177539.1 18137_t:CDS:2 [Funneliformis geosporum]
MPRHSTHFPLSPQATIHRQNEDEYWFEPKKFGTEMHEIVQKNMFSQVSRVATDFWKHVKEHEPD